MLIKDNKHIPQEDKDFFTVLRIGLWQKVEEPLSNNPDWSYIYKLACEQTVQGIVADGIGLIKAAYDRGDFGNTPFPSGPDVENIYTQFLDQSAQIIRQNYKVNQVQAKVCQLLESSSWTSQASLSSPSASASLGLGSGLDKKHENLPPSSGEGPACWGRSGISRGEASYFVVKGQEAAKNYPKPLLRCSGDIDLFVLPADYQRAQTILAQAADSTDHENKDLIDTSYFFSTGIPGDRIEVELHATLHPNLGKQIDSTLDQLQTDLFAGRETIDTYSCVYEFLHCLQHFHWSGLGIRQIIDWCMLLSAKGDSINRPRVLQAIIDMHLQHEWNHFLAFCLHYLGMSKAIYDTWNLKLETPNHTPSHFSASVAQLWHMCRTTGNMGHNHHPKERIPFTPLRLISEWNDNFRQYFAHRAISPTVSRELLKVKARIYWHALKGKFSRTLP